MLAILQQLIIVLTTLSNVLATLPIDQPLKFGAVASSTLSSLLVNKTSAEKETIKAIEISKLPFVGTYDNLEYGIKVEIKSIAKIRSDNHDGIEIVARGWKGIEPIGFSKDGTVEWERWRFYDPVILIEDINGPIIREWFDTNIQQLKQRRLREDPLEAIKSVLAGNMFHLGKDGKNIVSGKIGSTVSTFNPASGANNPVDGIARRVGCEGYAALRVGLGTTGRVLEASENIALLEVLSGSCTDPNFNAMTAAWFYFDATAIADGDPINSADFILRGTGASDAFGLTVDMTAASSTSDSTIGANDYGNRLGHTALQSDTQIAFGSWSTTADNTFPLNAAGLANINITAGTRTRFGTKGSSDRASTTPAWANSNANVGAVMADTGGATIPRLVVDHGVAGAPDIAQLIWFQ